MTLSAVNLGKTFVLHSQGGATIAAVSGCSFTVEPGEALALTGPSGAGKSTVLRCLYGNYEPDSGAVYVDHRGEQVDLVRSDPTTILDIRRHTVGWVSQFLRVIPRVPTLEVVAEPAVRRGMSEAEAEGRARELLTRLNVPSRLWNLAPATFSGGEQQRVNVARGLVAEHPVLLVDEPTASLDETNRDVVTQLLRESIARGALLVGIFHDAEVRAAIATRTLPVSDPLRRTGANPVSELEHV